MTAILRIAGYITEPRLTASEIHRIVGEPHRIAAAPPPRAIRVVTWNVERGVNLESIAANLASFHPDVILLQEVDRFCRRSGMRDVAQELAARLDMNWIAGGEFQEIGEAESKQPALTGQAILSRFAIDDASVVVFSSQARLRWRLNPAQPRRGGRMALRARTAGAVVYTVHIESGGDDALRQRQVDEVLADAGRQPESRAVIAGDFNNSAGARSALLQAFAASGYSSALDDVGDRQTQMNHPYQIDWVFARGFTSSAGWIERLDGVSDHYPLIVTLAARD